MAGEIDLATLLISLKADVEGLQASFDESQNVVRQATEEAEESADSFEQHIEAGFERVGERLLEYFAIEKVAEFINQSIEEYAKVERAFDVLGAQIDANGEKWQALKGNVDDFVEAEQSMYGTTKENVIAALSDAELGTKNLAAALKITDEAELLSTITHHSLQESVEEISRAYTGNTRGLRQLGNELKLTNTESANAGTVFKTLQERTEALNGALDDSQKKINALGTSWENLKESSGKFFDMFVPFVQFVLDDLSSGVNDLRTLNNVLDHTLRGFNDLLSFKNPFPEWKEINNDAESYSDTLDKIWGKQKAQGLESNKQQLAEVSANAKRAEDEKKTVKKKEDSWREYLKNIKTLQDEAVREERAETLAQHAAEMKAIDEHEKRLKAFYIFYDKAVKESEKLKEDAAKESKAEADAELQTVQDIGDKTLEFSGQAAALKTKDAGLQKAISLAQTVWSTAEAVMAQLTIPGPPGWIMAGLAAAEGVAQASKIESTSFAEGGIVTSPTFSTLGDGNEPEMALPLSKAREMGFGGGGDTHNHYNSFPGVTNRNEARAVGESHGAAFIRQQSRAKVLSGNRNTGF